MSWNTHGPAAVVRRRLEQLEHVMSVLLEMRDAQIDENDIKENRPDRRGRKSIGFTEDLWNKIRKIRSETGLTLGVHQDLLTVTAGWRDVFRYTINSSRKRSQELPYWTAKILKEARNARFYLREICETADFNPTPTSLPEARRTALEMACAIDRHDAFVRHALPSLRKTSAYVVMVDRLGIGIVTEDLLESSFEERCAAFASRLFSSGYLRTGDTRHGLRIVGNIMFAADTKDRIMTGIIDVPGDYTEALAIHARGKDISRILGGHSCSGVKAKVTGMHRIEDGIRIETNSFQQREFIPILIREGP